MEKSGARKHRGKSTSKKGRSMRSHADGAPATLPRVEFDLPLELPTHRMEMSGPTKWSNWVIKDRLLVGAYPKRKVLVKDMLMQGISVFVCLMQQKEIDRQGKHYVDVARAMCSDDGDISLRPDQLEYIHFPIWDRSVTEDDAVVSIVIDIIHRLQRGEKMFLHCRGGHGRTGTLVSLILGKMYDLDSFSAIRLCQEYHDQREDNPSGMSSPQEKEQRDQVHRLLADANVGKWGKLYSSPSE